MKKILVVEDDKFLASAYRVKLTKAQYEVKIASDGNAALKELENFIPDIIILDLIMPGMDGFTVLEKLRADARFKTTPVIVASNLNESEDIVKATKLGATDYIVKTDMTMKDLIVKIENLLGKNIQ